MSVNRHSGSAPLQPVAVIGGGITGLAAAWNLQQAGIPFVLFEASERCGGVISSIRQGDWLHESGPNSMLEGDSETSDLIEALGLGSRRHYAADAAKNRYVLRHGRLMPVPTSPGQFMRTNLFSWPAKFSLAAELFRPRLSSKKEESVSEFTQRRLGQEFLDYAVDPLVGGVYAGDPARLSVRHAFPKLVALEAKYRSLIWGAIRRRAKSAGPAGRIFSFQDGMEEFPRALAHRLGESVRLNTRVVSLRRDAGGWLVVSERAGHTLWEGYSAVVCALPAGGLARLRLEGCSLPEALSLLGEVEYPPIASVFTGFKRENVAHALDGFGMLVPKTEGRNFLGTLFSSTLFPGRSPAGHVALTTFVGGARQPSLGCLDDDALVRLVLSEMESLLGVRGVPAFVSVRRHARAIPQYNLGYDRFQTACSKAEKAAPGLHIGGNCRDGASLPACLASGRRLALAAAKSAIVTALQPVG
jgi:protoporphyrinogen/coproporphyrinogen III oxidase